LLTYRRRAEQALVSVVATSYLLGVSTRRVEKLVEQLGVANLSKSQVSQMAAHLDAQVEAFRNRPLDNGPYTFVWADALAVKVREAGRTVNVHAQGVPASRSAVHRCGRIMASNLDRYRRSHARSVPGPLVVDGGQRGVVGSRRQLAQVNGRPGW
jgi:Transposase, Mutator family